jgi:hypothetical protein
MPFDPSVFVLGIAVTDSGVFPANNIASMTFAGGRTIFDGTISPPEIPSEGDAVRVTVAGTLRVPANFGDATVAFQLWFPDANLPNPLGQVVATFPNNPNATIRPLLTEFLLTFRDVDPESISLDVYGNGLVAIGNGALTQNYLIGRSSNLGVGLQQVANLDVVALLTNPNNDPNFNVLFDQCIIEYLEVSTYFPPPSPTPSP